MLKKYWYVPLLVMIAASALVVRVSDVYAEFGTNWTAEYYDNRDLSGSPVTTRSGINGINFDFGDDPPIDIDDDDDDENDIDDDNFSIRFRSTQTFTTGTYEFVLSSDDGARVFIDGELVLDRFVGRSLTTDRFTRSFQTGTYSITVEYFEAEDNASIQFQWFLLEGEAAAQATIAAGGTVQTGPTPTPGPSPTPTTPPPTPLPPIPEGALRGTVINAQVLLVRSAPFFAENVVGRIRRGETYAVVGRDPDARWFLIQISGARGWVWGHYLFIDGNEFNAPVVSSFVAEGNPAGFTGVVVQTQSVMKLRAEPDAASEQIGRIGWGDVVGVTGITPDSGWLQVSWKGTSGWMLFDFVRVIEGEIEDVPVIGGGGDRGVESTPVG